MPYMYVKFGSRNTQIDIDAPLVILLLSGASRDRLAVPGGPADASLGIILHQQTKDGLLVIGS